jgi:hypothetical protein
MGSDADRWQIIAGRESARADAADAARRHAEDHARACDDRVAAAIAAQHAAERRAAHAVADVARLRARWASLETALREAARVGDARLGAPAHPFDGLVLRPVRGGWRATAAAGGAVSAEHGQAEGATLLDVLAAAPAAIVERADYWDAVADGDAAASEARRG